MNIQNVKVAPPPDGSTATRAASPPPQAATTATQAESTTQPVSIDVARHVARQINDFLKSSASEVQFTVDSESDKVVVRIVDPETKQVIRQMPSEEMLAISKSLDQLTGLLIQQKA